MKVAFIVDSEGVISEPLSMLLREQGYLVEVIDNEARAIRRFIRHVPDLIVANFGLWGGSLFSLAMRQAEGYPNTRVIALTTNPGAEPFENVDVANKDVIVCPFDIERLLDII